MDIFAHCGTGGTLSQNKIAFSEIDNLLLSTVNNAQLPIIHNANILEIFLAGLGPSAESA